MLSQERFSDRFEAARNRFRRGCDARNDSLVDSLRLVARKLRFAAATESWLLCGAVRVECEGKSCGRGNLDSIVLGSD